MPKLQSQIHFETTLVSISEVRFKTANFPLILSETNAVSRWIRGVNIELIPLWFEKESEASTFDANLASNAIRAGDYFLA